MLPETAQGIKCKEVPTSFGFGTTCKGRKTSFNCLRDTEAASNSQMGSPLSSGTLSNSNHTASPTDSTSLASGQTSEYEDTESDFHQSSSISRAHFGLPQIKDEFVIGQADARLLNSCISVSYPSNQYKMNVNPSISPGLGFVSLGQENRGRYGNYAGFELNFDAQKQLDLASWEHVLENCTPGFGTSVSSTQYATVGHMPEQENMIIGKLFTDELNADQEAVGGPEGHKKWQGGEAVSYRVGEAYKF